MPRLPRSAKTTTPSPATRRPGSNLKARSRLCQPQPCRIQSQPYHPSKHRQYDRSLMNCYTRCNQTDGGPRTIAKSGSSSVEPGDGLRWEEWLERDDELPWPSWDPAPVPSTRTEIPQHPYPHTPISRFPIPYKLLSTNFAIVLMVVRFTTVVQGPYRSSKLVTMNTPLAAISPSRQ